METAENGSIKFPLNLLVLVPHKDNLILIEKYRKNLFKAGYTGAFSFPPVVPLACISSYFTRAELKQAALKIRSLSLANNGMISSKGINNGDTGKIFGLLMDLPWEEEVFLENNKILYKHSQLILCCAYSGKGDFPHKTGIFPDLSSKREVFSYPKVSFRAAMTANLTIFPLVNCGEKYDSFKWRLSLPVWLPKVKKSKKPRQSPANS